MAPVMGPASHITAPAAAVINPPRKIKGRRPRRSDTTASGTSINMDARAAPERTTPDIAPENPARSSWIGTIALMRVNPTNRQKMMLRARVNSKALDHRL